MDLLGKGELRQEIETLKSQIGGLETRAAASNYTDAIVSLIAESIRDGNVGAQATAAYETVAGLWERAFASAEILPNTNISRAVTPAVLAMIGRELITNGEIVFAIGVSGGLATLTAAQSWDISGGVDPESWQYELTLPGPTESLLARRSASGVVHCRYGSLPSEPWRGQGPLQRAPTTGKLAGALETALLYEMGGPVGSIIPTPQGQRQGLADDLRALKGQAAIVDEMGGEWTAGQPNSRNQDWRQLRIGPTPPPELLTLRGDLAVSILTAGGVPSELVQKSDGSALREAWRQFLHGSVDPIAQTVAAELALKLDTPDLRLSFDRLFASDLSGRARAFQSMVASGMELGRAASLAGLVTTDD